MTIRTAGKDVEQWELLYIYDRNTEWYSHSGKQLGRQLKLNIQMKLNFIIWPNIPIPEYLP